MKQIKIATVGDSDDLELGEQVVAIGNALGYGQSVTCGYVSALDRDLTLTDESGAVISNTYTCRTHYLDIPVLVKFFPCNGLNVQFGPQLGIGLSLSDKWKGINNDDYSIYRDSAVDFSLAFGLGYEFNFGVFVDARYTLGLTKTIREVVKGFQGRNISLAVGYRVYL